MSDPQLYKVDLSKFSDEEQLAIEKLKEVGMLIHKIWEKQVDPKTGNANFYEKDLKKEEIETEAKNNPEILSPYTVVKKVNDKIVAVPYSKEYFEELNQISELLAQIGSMVVTKEEKSYYSGLAEDYKKGDFENALIRYIKDVDTKIFVLMGPIETYLDTTFGVKKAFQFNLRVLLEKETEETKRMVDIVKSKSLIRPSIVATGVITPEKVKVSVSDVIMFSGRQAGSTPSSTNLPDDSQLVKNFGTKIVFYRNAMFDKFDSKITPYLGKFIDFKLDEKKEEIKKAFYRFIALHEIVEATIKYDNFHERLRGYTDAIRELNASMLGIKNAKFMNLSGYLSDDEFTYIMLAECLYAVDSIARRESSSSIMQYAKGFAVLFNYGIEEGVFTIENGKIKLDFEKMARLTTLGSVLLEIFSDGDESDAKALFDKYGSFDFAKQLEI